MKTLQQILEAKTDDGKKYAVISQHHDPENGPYGIELHAHSLGKTAAEKLALEQHKKTMHSLTLGEKNHGLKVFKNSDGREIHDSEGLMHVTHVIPHK